MQPGEHFFLSPTNDAMPAHSTIATVTTPLQAMLGFQLNVSSQSYGTAGLCSSDGLIDQPDTCANNGQSCYSFCPFSLPGDGSAKNQWHVFAPFIAAWTYTRTNGQLVAQYQYDPDTNGIWTDFLVALTVSWTGTNWQVALDHSTGIERTTIANPVCDAAQYLFVDDARFNSVAGSSQSMDWKFFSGSNPAQGCVAEAFAETTAGTLCRTRWQVVCTVLVCRWRSIAKRTARGLSCCKPARMNRVLRNKLSRRRTHSKNSSL